MRAQLNNLGRSLNLVFSILVFLTVRSIPLNAIELNAIEWLRVDGKWIVNESGKKVMLRGISGAYTDPLNKWQDRIDWMKSKGMTCSRVAFDIPGIDLDKMDSLLDLFEKNEFYAVIDCHNSAVILERTEEWINTWSEIAKRYKDRSVVAIYEVCNEGFIWGENKTPVRSAFKRCIETIRKIDNRHICMVFENAGSEYAVRKANEGVSGSPSDVVLWRVNDPPPKDNCAIKLGSHWLELRYWAMDNKYEHSHEHPAYKYYMDKFDLAYCWASECGNRAGYLRELYNLPVLEWEICYYDYNDKNSNVAGVQEKIRLCEEQGICWNIWDWSALENPSVANYCAIEGKTDWDRNTWNFGKVTEYLDKVIPNFKSSYFDEIKPYDPKPFDLRKKIVKYSLPTSITGGAQEWLRLGYGPGGVTLLDSNCWIRFKGPCRVRVRWFNGTVPDLRRLKNFKQDKILKIQEDEQTTIKGEENTVIIFTPYSEDIEE